MGSWCGEVELFPGHQIEVIIDFDRSHDSKATVLSQARAWVARVRRHEPEYRRWVADQVEEERRNTDEPMIADDIERLLRVATLECASDGSARVYWEDDDVLYDGLGFYTQLDAKGTCVGIHGN
jgi:hypothetical protein